jgi:hypothetical protein
MTKIERKSTSNQLKKTTKKVVKKASKGKVKIKEPVSSKKTKAIKKQASKQETKKKQVVKKPVSKKTFPKKAMPKKEKTSKKKSEVVIEELVYDKNIVTGMTIMIDIFEVDEKTASETDLEILELEKKKKIYWSEDTEKAVVDFLKSDCNYYHSQLERYFEDCKKSKKDPDIDFVNELQEKFEWASQPEIMARKEKIYKDHIHKPLLRLVENIIFNFKLFRPGIDIKTLQTDCLSFVYGKFSNFNPDKNTKSFSFFGTIAKHYLMGEKKETDKGHQVNLDYDDHREEADGKETTEIGEKSDLDTSYQLFSHVIESIEKKIQKKLNNPEEKKELSDNDLKVADAIVNIFKNHELLGAYNKNHVYHLIKEYTGLQTKDITYSLARFRVFYRLLKQDFIKQNVNKD